MSDERALTEAERKLLALCTENNRVGRVGWRLQDWEGGAEALCRPLVAAGMLIERRLNHYPGVEITDAGRRALARATGGEHDVG